MTDIEKSYFSTLTERRSKLADALDDPCLRGVKKSIVDKYSDQAHFVYELIQNADDALATEASFDVYEDRLVFSHDGSRRFRVTNPLTEGEDYDNHRVGDINAITGIGLSSKPDSNKKGNAIGKFGMGFKSIFQYTNTPEIYDPNAAFKIERQIVPILLDHDYPGRKSGETLFVFPFNNADAKRPALDSLEKLNSLLFPTLFLNNLQVITFNYGSNIGEYRKRIVDTCHFGESDNVTTCERIEHTKTIQSGVERSEMLLFSRTDEENHRYAVGFMLGEDGRPTASDYKAFCFFPTKHETKLKFLIHAPFLLTDSRETIKEFEDHNRDMVGKLADLVYDCLVYMRDMRTESGARLVDDGILNILPIGDWGDSAFFKPFWENVSNCFEAERILPTDIDYVAQEHAYWPVTKQLPFVFPDEKIQSLYGNQDIHWVFRTKWKDADLDYMLSYFIGECVSASPTEVELLGRISAGFIEAQPLEWLSAFYKWLDESKDRRNKARKLPIFLNRNGKAVAAFDQKDQRILFLPATGSDNYQTVSETLLEDENAKELINRYELAPPSEGDLIRCIVDDKLPTAEGSEADAYFKRIVEYYVSLPQDEKAQLAHQMRGKVKLKCSDLASGECLFRASTSLYLPTDFIREYFAGMDNIYVVSMEHYHTLIEKRLWTDLDELLPRLGVNSMPVIMSHDMDLSEWRRFKERAENLHITFSAPADRYYWEQKFTEQYIHGASTFLKRILDESDPDVKKRLSLGLWRVLRFHAANYRSAPTRMFGGVELFGHRVFSFVGRARPNFLSGLHAYSYRGMNYEGFDSPQLMDFRSAKWIVIDDWHCESPDNLPINRLPQEYFHDAGDDVLVSMLRFREEESSAAAREAEAALSKAQAAAAARENLSDEQKSSLDMGEKARRLGLTDEDLEEAARQKAERRRAEERAANAGSDSDEWSSAEGGLSTEATEGCQAMPTVGNNGGSETQHDEDSPVGVDSTGNVTDDLSRPVHVNEHRRTRPMRGVLGNIAKNVEAISSAYKNDVPPPPLPELDEDDQDDDDELTPRSVDFEARIRNRELKQAREIAELERGDELQQKAKEAERYTFGWFKILLDLELLGKEKDSSEQREISLMFTKMEREPGTDRTYVLKRPSRNIPQWIEDLSGIPLDLYIDGKTVRPVIEVMSVQSFNLRVKLKADAKLEGCDLSRLVEAKITATRPAFLIEELRKGLASLPFEDSKNLRDDLTEHIEFIFGPPGTGKTTFLARDRIVPLMRRERDCKVLVLAPTNKAADVLTSRIVSILGDDKSYKDWLIRFGSTMDENLERLGLCPGKDVDLCSKPRHVVVTTIARFPYDFCITGNSAPQKLVDQEWDYIVIDEASMISLVSIIYPLYRKADAHFIIAGDPFQIEPIISCDLWKDENIYTMVGLRDFANPTTEPHSYQVVKLTTQYRSVPAVGRIFSEYRYGGILKHNRDADGQRALELAAMPEIRPLTLLKFPVSPYESVYRLKRLGQNGGSSYQVYSALFAFEFVYAIAKKMNPSDGLFRIGVISPYRAQADIVQKLVESVSLPSNVEISAGTVHGFQGDECEMVVALFNPPPGISGRKGSFINKKNIINVAVSRARDYLVVMMPDDRTQNLGNMLEVRKIERLMRDDPGHCIIHETSSVEKAVFGSETFIEDNAFSTGHQSVNVYGAPEMRYEVRSEETAVDVQIQHDVVVGAPDAQQQDGDVALPFISDDEVADDSDLSFVDFCLARNKGILDVARQYVGAKAKEADARNEGKHIDAIMAGFEAKKLLPQMQGLIREFEIVNDVEMDSEILLAKLLDFAAKEEP